MRNKIILVVAIIFGLVAAFGAYKYLETAEETYRLSGNYANVATAIRMIPAKTVINDQMLQFKEMPTNTSIRKLLLMQRMRWVRLQKAIFMLENRCFPQNSWQRESR